jgi:hypothetical protein
MPPFGKTVFTTPFTERESNTTMMYLDAILCMIGLTTTLFGVYVEGFTPLLGALMFISVSMGFFAIYRFTRKGP